MINGVQCYLRFISILRNVFKFSSGMSSKAALAAESSSYIFISSSACWIITQFWHPLMQHNSRGGGGGGDMGGFFSELLALSLFSKDGSACWDPVQEYKNPFRPKNNKLKSISKHQQKCTKMRIDNSEVHITKHYFLSQYWMTFTYFLYWFFCLKKKSYRHPAKAGKIDKRL